MSRSLTMARNVAAIEVAENREVVAIAEAGASAGAPRRIEAVELEKRRTIQCPEPSEPVPQPALKTLPAASATMSSAELLLPAVNWKSSTVDQAPVPPGLRRTSQWFGFPAP